MAVWAMWHGGSSYSYPYVETDARQYDDEDAAVLELIARSQDHRRYPSCDDATMTIWHYDPRDERDPYPDAMATLAPDGTVEWLTD